MCPVHGVRFQHVTAIFNAEISRSKLQKNEDEIDAKPEMREGQFRWSVSRIDLLFSANTANTMQTWVQNLDRKSFCSPL